MMDLAAAVDALKPLLTQHRAIAALDGILNRALQVAGDSANAEARLAELRAECEAMEAQTQADRQAHAKRRADAKAKADEMEARATRAEERLAKAEAEIAAVSRIEGQYQGQLDAFAARVKEAETAAAKAEAEAAETIRNAHERAAEAVAKLAELAR